MARNAVDHGIESPELRLERGKNAKGKLSIRAALDGSKALRLSIADDGGGVNWERLRAIGAKRGMPHTTHDDLVEVMFSSGVSTAEQVTELLGRGVGTTATKRACEALGGRVEVRSSPGEGTEIAFVIPTPRDTQVVLPLDAPALTLHRAS